MELTESRNLKTVDFALRLAAALLSLVALSLLLSASHYLPSGLPLSAFKPFEYLLIGSAGGLIHSAIQAGVSAWYCCRTHSLTTHACYYPHFRFAKDMVCTLLLLSSSSAVLGATTLNDFLRDSKYIEQANAAAALSLFAFLCLINSTIISFYRLPCHI
ncbi:hypothetical protein KP509_05G100700 [Ceratopteris richardii]|uniref:CASP-like protein n=1 Tax=Ceratopteris richardii TaxID=49495 RepID=A0A8T2UWR3_CERRI|nr:hypothetical protein KP509_05G100700 [Ceratopteris richardii]